MLYGRGKVFVVRLKYGNKILKCYCHNVKTHSLLIFGAKLHLDRCNIVSDYPVIVLKDVWPIDLSLL